VKSTTAERRRYLPAVGPRLATLLLVVFGLFSLLTVNSIYLVAVRLLEWSTGKLYQNWFYMNMFLMHLLLGALIVVPVIVFGGIHIANAHSRPNRRAVRAGYALFSAALILLVTGILLTRVVGVAELKNPSARSIVYWLHVLAPVAAGWLFVLHRLAGRRIRWRLGAKWAAVAVGFAAIALPLHSLDPRTWGAIGPASGEKYFFPSLARTASAGFIPERALANDRFCLECHPQIHERWASSVHRFSSFNNPPYAFSVRTTRRVALARDGNVQASRFCAGCHDPVVFFSGKFDDPHFNDATEPAARAGITCSVCHGITRVNSVRGNADYTIDEPVAYPFTYSASPFLRLINRQLIKAKPELHKRSYLKPLHQNAEFCGTCHKVHLPQEFNHYRWLRGQNHYDTYLLSGVSGHGAQSFYYPKEAVRNCDGCHMKARPSTDFGARMNTGVTGLSVHDHFFPAANTAIPRLTGRPPWAEEEERKFLQGTLRVDIFGIHEGRTTESPLIAPLPSKGLALSPGYYIIDVVVRTLKMGHPFTQGTADSNEVWLDLSANSGVRRIGRSGALGPLGDVDPWSHFINAYVLDRDANRIERRNPEDIFTTLYNHQIPPGAADVIHYELKVPDRAVDPITIDVKLQYRKFDATYMRLVYGDRYVDNLPVTTIASARLTLPTANHPAPAAPSKIPEWERWNDYGIGLLSHGELRQAETAFARVEALGHAEGAVNLARVYLAESAANDKAVAALQRAVKMRPPAPPWTVAWLSGEVNRQNGRLAEAVRDFTNVLEADDAEMRRRGFDFRLDYRIINSLGQTLYELAATRQADERLDLLKRSRAAFERVLELEPEEPSAHYGLHLVCRALGDEAAAAVELTRFVKYKSDDHARDAVVAAHWPKNPAALHASERITIYDASRPEAYGLYYRYEIGPNGKIKQHGLLPDVVE
jgi:tetratricopeptide (TPR) repeat protein